MASIIFTDVAVHCHNKREQSMLGILNTRIKYVIDEMIADSKIGASMRESFGSHWMFDQMNGLLDAMYFLDMITEPVTGINIYEACVRVTDTAERKKVEEQMNLDSERRLFAGR